MPQLSPMFWDVYFMVGFLVFVYLSMMISDLHFTGSGDLNVVLVPVEVKW